MTQIYCGNNARNRALVSGDVKLGTRYGCLRKGIATGLNMKKDYEYRGEYVPIDKTVIYCGNKRRIPNGYDRFGSLPQCLQKGVGIGKRIRVSFIGVFKSVFFVDVLLPILLFILFSLLTFIVLYLLKPERVIKRNAKGEKVIVWGKFMTVFIPIVVAIGVLLFWVWRYYLY
jgi:hypothetical protein